jgi:hypothetical protein
MRYVIDDTDPWKPKIIKRPPERSIREGVTFHTAMRRLRVLIRKNRQYWYDYLVSIKDLKPEDIKE